MAVSMETQSGFVQHHYQFAPIRGTHLRVFIFIKCILLIQFFISLVLIAIFTFLKVTPLLNFGHSKTLLRKISIN